MLPALGPGDEPATALWRPRTSPPAPSGWWPTRVELLAGDGEQLTAAERSRRERMREGGAGITAFSVDEAGTLAVFALSSRLFVADLAAEAAPRRELPAAGPVVDPRCPRTARHVAYVGDGALHVVARRRLGGTARTGRAGAPT